MLLTLVPHACARHAIHCHAVIPVQRGPVRHVVYLLSAWTLPLSTIISSATIGRSASPSHSFCCTLPSPLTPSVLSAACCPCCASSHTGTDRQACPSTRAPSPRKTRCRVLHPAYARPDLVFIKTIWMFCFGHIVSNYGFRDAAVLGSVSRASC